MDSTYVNLKTPIFTRPTISRHTFSVIKDFPCMNLSQICDAILNTQDLCIL